MTGGSFSKVRGLAPRPHQEAGAAEVSVGTTAAMASETFFARAAGKKLIRE